MHHHSVTVVHDRWPAPRPRLAFLTAIPIAVPGGLIGLGGAEFRLPVLAGPLRYSAKQAVPLNLAVSMVTILASLATRLGETGLGIGLVSSLLGVAGGELIIPTLVFAFGADIKFAGTASLLVSLPTVIVGIARYAGRGAYKSRSALTGTVAPMGVGSVIGALIGGALIGFIPAGALKTGLGVIVIASVLSIFRHAKPS